MQVPLFCHRKKYVHKAWLHKSTKYIQIRKTNRKYQLEWDEKIRSIRADNITKVYIMKFLLISDEI